MLQQSQIYIIHSDSLDKFLAAYVEGRLIQKWSELDIPLINKMRPFGRGLGVRPEIEQLVAHAELLLHAAGFTRLGSARRNPPPGPRRLSVTADLDELIAIAPEDLTIPAEAERCRLACRDLRAEGYKWMGRLLVMPGSEYALGRTETALSEDNRKRRRMIEDATRGSMQCPATAPRCGSVSIARARLLPRRS